MSKKILFILFFILPFYLPAQTDNAGKAFKKVLDKRSGIPIYFECGAETFPAYWHTPEISAECSSLDREERDRSAELVKKAMAKYPVAVLQQNIKKVYVLKTIRFYGQPFGGTNSLDAVYLTNNGVSLGYTDSYIEQVFHHEFSSVLLRNFPAELDTGAWVHNNTAPYGKGGVYALQSVSAGTVFDSLYWKHGFLYQYAQSDMENDFNSFAENIFAPNPGFWDAISHYPALQNKLNLIIAFYNRLNPAFTRDYFYTIK
ncbi:MAG: hypothetical protein IBJ09_09470 [Bacteroidia bacterium]|nr:hypothetical protein [Bacteroidia bacterium]